MQAPAESSIKEDTVVVVPTMPVKFQAHRKRGWFAIEVVVLSHSK
jgi:hypothetical protein